MTKRLYVVVAALALCCTTATYADTIYDLTLTAPKAGGSGSFTLNVAPSTAPGSVTTYYAPGGVASGGILESFSVSVAGLTFNLDNASEATSVQFTGGVLSDVTYGTSIGAVAFQATRLIYGVVGIADPSVDQIGSVSATPAVPTGVTPEPGTLLLLGTGLLGIASTIRRRLS